MKTRLHRLVRCVFAGIALTALAACGGGSGGSTSSTTYTVSGTVTGLSSSGLILRVASGKALPVSASGTFTLDERFANGASYNVFVVQDPDSPRQLCHVDNGAGVVRAANVTNVVVTCVNGYTVGGIVSGLTGSGLVIQIATVVAEDLHHRPILRYGERMQVNASGAFIFKTVYPANFSGPALIVRQQPSSPAQSCIINNSSIRITTENQTNVSVVCTEFAFATNNADDTLSAYIVDANDGGLLSAGAPIAVGDAPSAIIGTHDKRHVFVANQGSNDISVFAVDPATGALTPVPGSPFASCADPGAMTLVMNDAYLYVACAGSRNLAAYAVNADSRELTPLSPAIYATGSGPSSIAVMPGAPRLFVASHGGTNDISAFTIDTSTGALSPVAGSPFAAGGNPRGLAFGTNGQFLFTAGSDGVQSAISGFNVDLASGALTAFSVSASSLPVSNSFAIDRTGSYLYATSGSEIVGYRIDANTGALTALPGFPVAAGADAYSVSIDPMNQFLYVTNEGAANIAGFKIDVTTGALTAISGAPFPAGNKPRFVATF